MSDVTFTSDIAVDLVRAHASDESVVWAARVSTLGDGSTEGADPRESKGLINYLMRERHGCYDSDTDVLTSGGWKNWRDVEGTERFLTLNLETGATEYQFAERLIRKEYTGPMIHFGMNSVDLLVTPDHNVLAQVRSGPNEWKPAALIPASSLLDRAGRFSMASGEWRGGEIHAPEIAEIVGFIAADGNFTGTSIAFHLHRDDKLNWLKSRHAVTVGDCGRVWLPNASEDLRRWAKQTYTETGDRCLPRELVVNADAETARALLDGYLAGDGSVTPQGKLTASSVSRQLISDLQELAVKCGVAAVETAPAHDRESAFGSKPLYRVTFYRDRNSMPRIGWTKESRSEQVTVVDYDGEVHCVTVPNGTLYVRRNGIPVWSGNSPFEHNSFTFRVTAPIFVWREHMRHRVGFSYNEESGRYRQLQPVFYVPARDRALIQVGKTGEYRFEAGSVEQHDLVEGAIYSTSIEAYERYTEMLDTGIAREVARMVLPVNIFSTAYVTCNARSLMNFLSLRTKDETSTFPSYPQREIEMVAEQYEQHFADFMPIVHVAFGANGRVAP